METGQSTGERSIKSKQLGPAVDTAAAAHGALRQLAGFDPMQLVGEFRALRASVLALWRRRAACEDADATGRNQPDDMESAAAAGFDHHFSKPLMDMALFDLVASLFAKTEGSTKLKSSNSAPLPSCSRKSGSKYQSAIHIVTQRILLIFD